MYHSDRSDENYAQGWLAVTARATAAFGAIPPVLGVVDVGRGPCPEPRDFLQEWVESITWKGMDMKPSRFTEEQIIGILREQEAGVKTADVCRSCKRASRSRHTLYRTSL
jgi:Transposase